jgi:alkylmercury lyase
MKLKLATATKDAFVGIISSLGIDKVKDVFQSFLKNGVPLSMAEFAQLMGLSESDAIDLAKNKGELNESGELVGFLGLSIVPTNHQLIINNKNFYTWCAADTLIFPAILEVEAKVISADPITGEAIRVAIENDILTSIEPGQSMISWIDDVDDADIRCSMCNRVHFFASGDSANKWHNNNQEARVFSVPEFYSTDIEKANCC